MRRRVLWLLSLFVVALNLWAQSVLPQNLQRQYDRAVQLARQGKYQQAEPLLREVVRQKPDFAPARLTLGLVYRMMNQPDKAIPHLRRAGELDPRNPTPLLELTRIALDQGKLNEAEAYLRTLRTRFPNHEELPLLTGALHIIRGQWGPAYDEFSKAVKKRPNDFRIHYNLGISASQLNKPEEAIKHLERAVQLKPDYATGWKALALLYETRQRTEDAIRAYTHALKQEPDDLPSRLKRAMLYQRVEKWEQALADYQHIARLYPRNPEAHLGAGLILMRLNRFAEARRHLGAALALFNPGQPIYYDILTETAHCELRLKNYGKAREHFAEVLRLDSKNARAYEGQWQVLQAQEVEQDLLPFLRRWAENLPDDPRPLLYIAQVYERNRRADLAEQEYNTLLERFPNDSNLRLEYARFLTRQGRNEDANAQYDLLLSRSPNEVGALFAKARAEEKRGAHREALQLYEQILQVDPTNTPALLGKAAMHRRLGELEPAIEIYRQLTFQPEPNTLALSNLVNLYEEANRTDELIAFLRECVQKLGQNYLNLLVAQLIKAGRADEAVQEYQNAIQREPNNSNLWRTLGLIYEQTERPDEAQRAYERALALNPNDTWTIVQLANLHRKREEHEKAWQLLTRGLRTNPDDISLYPNLEQLAQTLERQEEYLALVRELAQRDTPGQEPLKAYVQQLRRQGKTQEALALVNRRLRTRPEDGNLLRLQVSLLDELGRHADALPSVARLARLNPNDVGTLRGWAIRAEQYGSTIDIVQAYQALFNLLPDDISVGLKLARYYELLGQRERALELLDALQSNFPNNEDIRRVRQQMSAR